MKIKERVRLVNEAEFRRYKQAANRVLEQTEKARLYKTLMPYLTGEKEITRENREEISREFSRVKAIMKKDGWSYEEAREKPEAFKWEVKRYLEHCRVSPTDADVLALAIREARRKKNVTIFARDAHLKDAIKILQKKYRRLSKYLAYEEPGEWK